MFDDVTVTASVPENMLLASEFASAWMPPGISFQPGLEIESESGIAIRYVSSLEAADATPP